MIQKFASALLVVAKRAWRFILSVTDYKILIWKLSPQIVRKRITFLLNLDKKILESHRQKYMSAVYKGPVSVHSTESHMRFVFRILKLKLCLTWVIDNLNFNLHTFDPNGSKNAKFCDYNYEKNAEKRVSIEKK